MAQWTCKSCTCNNDEEATACKVCKTQKGGPQVKQVRTKNLDNPPAKVALECPEGKWQCKCPVNNNMTSARCVYGKCDRPKPEVPAEVIQPPVPAPVPVPAPEVAPVRPPPVVVLVKPPPPNTWPCGCGGGTNNRDAAEMCVYNKCKNPGFVPTEWVCTFGKPRNGCSAKNSLTLNPDKCKTCGKKKDTSLTQAQADSMCAGQCWEQNLRVPEYPSVIFKCGHVGHIECLEGLLRPLLITEAVTEIECPADDCVEELTQEDCNKFFKNNDKAKVNTMTLRRRQKDILNAVGSDYKNCPGTDCNAKALFQPGAIKHTCLKCGTKTCMACKVPWHENKTCYQFEKEAQEGEMLKLGLVKCYFCHKWVGKMAGPGCTHIDCQCQKAFCWTCGGPYPFCFCKIYKQGEVRLHQDCNTCLNSMFEPKYTGNAGKQLLWDAHVASHTAGKYDHFEECTTCTNLYQKCTTKEQIKGVVLAHSKGHPTEWICGNCTAKNKDMDALTCDLCKQQR